MWAPANVHEGISTQEYLLYVRSPTIIRLNSIANRLCLVIREFFLPTNEWVCSKEYIAISGEGEEGGVSRDIVKFATYRKMLVFDSYRI